MLEAMPMATPPVTRHTTKAAKLCAHPVSTDETAKSAADHHPVITEQQAAQSGDGGDGPDVAGVVVCGRNRLSYTRAAAARAIFSPTAPGPRAAPAGPEPHPGGGRTA